MSRNRGQFQMGYSLTQFMDEYRTEEKCCSDGQLRGARRT